MVRLYILSWKMQLYFAMYMCVLLKDLAAVTETYENCTPHFTLGTTWPPHLQFASYATVGACTIGPISLPILMKIIFL